MLVEITHSCWPQEVTQILLPSGQVGNGFIQNNRVHVSVPQSKEGLAVHWRESCAEEASGGLGWVTDPFCCRFFFTCKSRTTPHFPDTVFLLAICTVQQESALASGLSCTWSSSQHRHPPRASRTFTLWGFTARTRAQVQFLRPDTTVAQCPEWKLR